MIKSKDAVREEFSGCSTCSNYYDTKGHAIHAFDAVLKDFGYRLDCEQWLDLNGNEGRVNWQVIEDIEDCPRTVGCAVLSWYRMPSGRYEFIGYLA